MNPADLKRLFPNASESTLKRNTGNPGIRSTHAKLPDRGALEHSTPRKEKSSHRPIVSSEPRRRCRILFTVYSVRPADWDNYSVKRLQDLCVKAGLLDGDGWDILEGSVKSEKAYSKEEERTEVRIEEGPGLTPFA